MPPPAPPAAPDPAPSFERRLARVTPERTLRVAVETVLAAWRAQALRADETPSTASLEAIAHARNLEDLRLTGNLSMLRLLNLPAVLEIRLPGTNDPYFVVLAGFADDAATLLVDGETVRVAPAELDRVWFGDAHVLWRDFEWLGPTFGAEGKGEHVARLQRVLARAGLYGGQPTGTFDVATREAVLRFQRSRRLDADCRVGRLTRIALYAAAGTYRAPSLAGDDAAAAAAAAQGGPS